MAELLLELLSEEIPARMQARAAEDLKRLVCDGLKAAGLSFDSAQSHVTPRRLVLVVDGLPDRQPDVTEERKGPQVGAPDKAIQGFLGSVGLALEDCEQREIKGKTFYFAVTEKKGRATKEVLEEAIADAVQNLSWPKSMRWSDKPFTWIRPLRNVLAVFNGKGLQGGFFGLPFRMTTNGHRFLAPDPITVNGFTDYKAKLRDAKVMLDAAERRAKILADAGKLAAAEGLTLKQDDGLLDEVTGLAGWPVVMIGRIDAGFMDLPPEVLTTSMRHHQKYFSLLDAEGNLAPWFIVVAATEATDGGKRIVAGNERVLRARLSDAKFFWDQDRKRKLEDRIDALRGRVFHAKLGTVAEKVARMVELGGTLAGFTGADPPMARRAALLCKADLSTEMVGEFPELQGTMGRYYALDDGEPPDVATAIAEHYSPQGPNDACPSAPVSVAVALADKIDTLVAFFGIDQKPTGSKDPFALRRAALGVIRLIVENRLRIPLRTVFWSSFDQYEFQSSIFGPGVDEKTIEEDDEIEVVEPIIPEGTVIVSELLDFFADRLRAYLRDKGVRHDLISAVFAVRQTEQEMPGEVDLIGVLKRVDALDVFLDTDDGANLLVAYRRAANIVRIEENKDGTTFQPAEYKPESDNDIEAALWDSLQDVLDDVEPLLKDEDFEGTMAVLARLRKPVDNFFDNVTVNVKDNNQLRRNRLRLLAYIVWTMNQVADFSKIEGGER